jgi:transcriptional regulator with XRE-family HTH domain
MARIDFRAAYAKAQRSAGYWTERAILDYTSDLWLSLRQKRLSQRQLAEKVGKSEAYVSKIFGGEQNMTIGTMVELAHAVDKRLQIKLVDAEIAADKVTTGVQVNARPVVTRACTPTFVRRELAVCADAANEADTLMQQVAA